MGLSAQRKSPESGSDSGLFFYLKTEYEQLFGCETQDNWRLLALKFGPNRGLLRLVLCYAAMYCDNAMVWLHQGTPIVSIPIIFNYLGTFEKMMPELIQPSHEFKKAIILVGMAGAGKSTLGKELAQHIGWGHVDTDRILEAWWGMKMQEITTILSRQAFLDAEAKVVQDLHINRCVISTGGSVIYRSPSIAHLRSLGPCIYLEAGLETIAHRIARAPERGLSMAPEQTIEELLLERKTMYEACANFTVRTDIHDVKTCVEIITSWLQDHGVV